MFGSTTGPAQVIVPERWLRWADKCREHPASARPFFSATLAMFDESAARHIEQTVPDARRAVTIRSASDDEARRKLVLSLGGPLSIEAKRAAVSAWLCRDPVGAAHVAADPTAPVAVRLLIRQGQQQQW